MLNSISPFKANPRFIQADAITDLSFVKWTSYLNGSNSNLFIVASHVSDFVDLYGFNKCGYVEKNNSPVKRLNRFQASATISSLSDARNGIVAYGCNNGKYGLLEVKSKSNNGNLVSTEKIHSMGDTYISAVDLKDDSLFIGTQNGTLAAENIKHHNSKRILNKNGTPIKAIHASSTHICLVGHDSGSISLWDLRDRQENVLNYTAKKNYRSSCQNIGTIRTCHLKNDFVAIAGTSHGNVKFFDMRFLTQKYPDALKVSKKSITSVRFAENSSNTALITCYEGYVEVKNDALISLWFNDNELDVPPWLKGNHYDKLQTSWSCQLKDLLALDTYEDKIVMGTNGGDLCFIIPP
uniref:Uncharacterized protein n=1 Tax=Panagrolaimus sp. ES5 TaxID=591445 RepID=A0AC34GYB4_9BILA